MLVTDSVLILYDEKVHESNHYSFDKYHFQLKNIAVQDIPNSLNITISDQVDKRSVTLRDA